MAVLEGVLGLVVHVLMMGVLVVHVLVMGGCAGVGVCVSIGGRCPGGGGVLAVVVDAVVVYLLTLVMDELMEEK